jgi:predicted transcriptional regulator
MSDKTTKPKLKLTDITPESSLEKTRQYLRDNYEDGCICPACKQNVKLYPRMVGATQARALILLNQLSKGNTWVHIREIVTRINVQGDFAKMIYWGLIEEQQNDSEKKKNSGLWKITEKGVKFINNEITIAKYANVYNSQLLGFSEGHITIEDSLGKKFNYTELLNATV